jgi:hypothetical protein
MTLFCERITFKGNGHHSYSPEKEYRPNLEIAAFGCVMLLQDTDAYLEAPTPITYII